MCIRYSITDLEQERFYTSKASFLDCNKIPVYNADNPTEYSFSGKRVKRGLYKTKQNQLINADCNGAANIQEITIRGFIPDRRLGIFGYTIKG